jgi:hypothetical protein
MSQSFVLQRRVTDGKYFIAQILLSKTSLKNGNEPHILYEAKLNYSKTTPRPSIASKTLSTASDANIAIAN